MSANHSNPNLSTMPDLCLLSLFRRLPLSTLYGTVGQVCRNWTRLQSEALARRRRLVLMSSRSELEEVIDRLYNQWYHDMECDDMRSLSFALGRQGHRLVTSGQCTRTRYSLEDILWSVLCIREPYHFVIADYDHYLHQIPEKLPRITTLAVMFGYIPTREELVDDIRIHSGSDYDDLYDVYDIYDSDHSEDYVFPEFIKSDEDLNQPALKAVTQLCTVLGHYRHQLVHLTVELNLNRYLDYITLNQEESREGQQAADHLFRSLNTMTTSLRELCLQHYVGPKPSEQLSAALGSNLNQLVASFELIQYNRHSRPLFGVDSGSHRFGASLTTLTLAEVRSSTVLQVVRQLSALATTGHPTAATAVYPRLISLSIDFDGLVKDDGGVDVRLPSVKSLCLSGFLVDRLRAITANLDRCFPSLQVMQFHSLKVGLLSDIDLAECWPDSESAQWLNIVRVDQDRVFIQRLAA